MANVIVDKDKLDVLANAISAKSGEPLTLTLDEMVEAVDGIEVGGGGGVTPTGNIDITSAGVTDVTNYATATVASGSATASATKGAVNNHSVTVTPSVTTTAGYVTAGTSSGTAVTVSASELVSGSQTITTNDTYDVTNLAEVVVAVQGGGYVWQDGQGYVHVSDDDGAPTLIAKSITQNGTYDPATDGADGYSSVTVNVSGGSSGYTLLGSMDVTVNTTSTSPVTLADTLTIPAVWTGTKLIYVMIRDKAGKRANYFYGTDLYFANYHAAEPDGYTSINSGFPRYLFRCNADGTYGAYTSTSAYGVYLYSIDDTGLMYFQARYSSTNTFTIDGTYEVKVYAIDIDPFP